MKVEEEERAAARARGRARTKRCSEICFLFLSLLLLLSSPPFLYTTSLGLLERQLERERSFHRKASSSVVRKKNPEKN